MRFSLESLKIKGWMHSQPRKKRIPVKLIDPIPSSIADRCATNPIPQTAAVNNSKILALKRGERVGMSLAITLLAMISWWG